MGGWDLNSSMDMKMIPLDENEPNLDYFIICAEKNIEREQREYELGKSKLYEIMCTCHTRF
jgi:hypothetical protein